MLSTLLGNDCADTAWGIAELAADFSVWLLGSDAAFLQNRVLYVNWDVDELIAMKERVVKENLLTVGVRGWDSTAMYV